MINGIEGIPGSGKSYEAVVYQVLEFLKLGRLVVTNLPLDVDMFAAIDPGYRSLIEVRRRSMPVRGTWDASRIDDQGNGSAFELWPEGHSEEPPARGALETDGKRVKLRSQSSAPVFGGVWDYYHVWKHPKTGQGPVFLIDECHVPLPVIGTDEQVVEWFKLHRHFNIDVVLMSQSFRDVCQAIARLLAMLIRCRKADFLGKKDRYVRKVFAGYRGSLVSQEERRYLPQFFPLYKSHTQGMSVSEAGASDVSPFIVKWKRYTVAWWLCGAVLIAWLFWPSGKGKASWPVSQVKASVPLGKASGAVGVPVAPADVAMAPSPKASDPVEVDPEPLSGKGLHLRGHMTFGGKSVYVFVVSQNGQPVETLSDGELRAAGYVFRPSGSCTGTVEWKGKARGVSCDLPAVNVVVPGRSGPG